MKLIYDISKKSAARGKHIIRNLLSFCLVGLFCGDLILQ